MYTQWLTQKINLFCTFKKYICIFKIDWLDGIYENFKYFSVRNWFFTIKENNSPKTLEVT